MCLVPGRCKIISKIFKTATHLKSKDTIKELRIQKRIFFQIQEFLAHITQIQLTIK